MHALGRTLSNQFLSNPVLRFIEWKRCNRVLKESPAEVAYTVKSHLSRASADQQQTVWFQSWNDLLSTALIQKASFRGTIEDRLSRLESHFNLPDVDRVNARARLNRIGQSADIRFSSTVHKDNFGYLVALENIAFHNDPNLVFVHNLPERVRDILSVLESSTPFSSDAKKALVKTMYQFLQYKEYLPEGECKIILQGLFYMHLKTSFNIANPSLDRDAKFCQLLIHVFNLSLENVKLPEFTSNDIRNLVELSLSYLPADNEHIQLQATRWFVVFTGYAKLSSTLKQLNDRYTQAPYLGPIIEESIQLKDSYVNQLRATQIQNNAVINHLLTKIN